MLKKTVAGLKFIVGRLTFLLLIPAILLAIIAIAVDAGRIDDPY